MEMTQAKVNCFGNVVGAQVNKRARGVKEFGRSYVKEAY